MDKLLKIPIGINNGRTYYVHKENGDIYSYSNFSREPESKWAKVDEREANSVIYGLLLNVEHFSKKEEWKYKVEECYYFLRLLNKWQIDGASSVCDKRDKNLTTSIPVFDSTVDNANTNTNTNNVSV